jgi:hypothetical protein
MTLHAGYAESRISSNLKANTRQFGWSGPGNQEIPSFQQVLRTPQPSELTILELLNSFKPFPCKFDGGHKSEQSE